MPDKEKNARVRFAPAPTGNLHIGGARSALFNYLFAKQRQGDFILRIDDTDVERSKPEYEKNILESFKWLGINWDEGPYRQSDRLNIYGKYLKKLLDEDRAYYCFCSEEELEAQKQDQQSRGEAPKYVGTCRNLPKEEAEKKLKEGKSPVIRFRIEPIKVKFKDIVRGEVEFDMGLVGDIIIAKNLTTPLYNFTSVIDDFEMKISHIIRGEEHLSNTPKQILLQGALKFSQPEYAHLPMILGADRSKLSKREGATAVSDYRKNGYLPEAIVNFIAFLGWNPGGEEEIYSMDGLIKEFSLEKVQKGGAIFNNQRLDYLNGFYIRQKPIDELTKLCLPYLPARPGGPKTNIIEKIIALHQERLKKLSEITELTDFFFKDTLEYDKELLKWKNMSDGEVKEILDRLDNILCDIPENKWTEDNLEKALMPEAEKAGDRGKLLWPLRVALTGKKASAGPFEVAEAMGKEKSLARIKQARELLSII